MPGYTNGHDQRPILPAQAPQAAAHGQAAPGYDERLPQTRGVRHSDMAVGQAIRDLRRAQSRTQKDLARRVGVTGAQLHRYETGSTRIAASRLIAIAEALGVGPESLIAAGTDRAPPAPMPPGAGGEIVELIELYGALGDPRQRKALLAVARMMAAQAGDTTLPEDAATLAGTVAPTLP
jgi:transcriptional regulator with XRE-family HTH domain